MSLQKTAYFKQLNHYKTEIHVALINTAERLKNYN